MIELIHLSKTFQVSDGTVEALRDITLHIEKGDIYGIIGMSGAGKSTLVRCINMLEQPTSGQVIVDGKEMDVMSATELREARRSITMIFQGFNLLMQRNCLQNICFPMELAGIKKADARRRALELLELVGLPDKANAYPAQLSGGQQQRVAIARALAINPKVLLCDEATSALDPNTTHSILALIKEINQKLGITVVVITHQMSVVEDICNHVAILDGGSVVEEGPVSEVFSSPKSPAAKKLVFPSGVDETLLSQTDGRRVRLVFNGAQVTGAPIIAKMAVDIGVLANIIAASTRTIEAQAYGNMLLDIPSEGDQLARALAYLRAIPNVIAEEVND